MTVRINKQKINLREKLAGVEDKVNFDEVIRGLGENTAPLILNKDGGNVGIGTTSPSAKLEISTSETTGLRLINPASSPINGSYDPPAILFQANGWDTHVGSRAYSARIRVNSNYSAASDRGNTHPVMNFDLETNEHDPDDNLSTKMMINAAGNVGIGTTSPGTGISTVATVLQIENNNLPLIKLKHGVGGSSEFYKTGAADLCFAQNEELAMVIDSLGNVGIGTASPGSYKLNINGTARVSSGDVTSDDRVKHNEQPIIGALETISKITPKKYIKTVEMYESDHDFELDADGNPVDSNGEPVEHRIEAGVIAQQVLTVDELAFAVSPEGVDEDGVVTSPHGLDYNSLFTYAIAAIQEQQTIIEDLKSRIETLEQQ